MAITGGIKFFADNPALTDNGGSVSSITSGSVVQNYLIDKLAYTYWTSVGSTDLIVETIVLLFTSTTITRLLLLDHNWKQYTVKYWNGAAYVDFSSVVGLDGSLVGGISETTFADDSSYYEFASVTTTRLQITVTKTQVANAQKYIATIFPTSELSTLSGYPQASFTLDRLARTSQMLSGRVRIVKQMEVAQISLSFQNYPVLTYGADIDAILTLIDRETPFYAWLCGGRRGSNYFSYAIRGWRLRDCFRMQIDSAFAANWTQGLYKSGQNLGDLVLSEHV